MNYEMPKACNVEGQLRADSRVSSDKERSGKVGAESFCYAGGG